MGIYAWPVSVLSAAAAFALAGCASAPPPATAAFVVAVGMNGESCWIRADGRAVTANALLPIARREAGRGRAARIEADDESTPYRCVGGVIVTLQMAGFKTMGFTAEPPP
ncbi:MAG: ExbD/TolR family protein [Sphingobium sp.]